MVEGVYPSIPPCGQNKEIGMEEEIQDPAIVTGGDDVAEPADDGKGEGGTHEDPGIVGELNLARSLLAEQAKAIKDRDSEIAKLRKHSNSLLEEKKREQARRREAEETVSGGSPNTDMMATIKAEFDDTLAERDRKISELTAHNEKLLRGEHCAWVQTEIMKSSNFNAICPEAFSHLVETIAEFVKKDPTGNGNRIQVGDKVLPSTVRGGNAAMTVDELLRALQRGREPNPIPRLNYCFRQAGAGSGTTGISSGSDGPRKPWQEMTAEERARAISGDKPMEQVLNQFVR